MTHSSATWWQWRDCALKVTDHSTTANLDEQHSSS